MSFSNKVVIVTGASSGIGAATAIEFAKEGADVAIVGRNEAKIKKVAEQCEKYGKAPLIIKRDISTDEGAKAVVAETVKKFGKLDILINNAGCSRDGNILDGTILKSYDDVMNTNLRAVVQITTLAAPYLIATKGNVINISSILSTRLPSGQPNFLAYCVSKAGLDHFTRGAALELASSGVRVNSINPGPVRTDFLDNIGYVGADWDSVGKSNTALGRVSEPIEIAQLAIYLASDKAVSITGSIHVIDNGGLLK